MQKQKISLNWAFSGQKSQARDDVRMVPQSMTNFRYVLPRLRPI